MHQPFTACVLRWQSPTNCAASPLSSRRVPPTTTTPTPPNPTVSEWFATETPKHIHYLLNYLVHPCPQQAQCTLGHKCFHYHSEEQRRRRPEVIGAGREKHWNYNACWCAAAKDQQVCEMRDRCRYAHNTHEINFHPSRFKTQTCKHASIAGGGAQECRRNGMHCPFSHQDLRKGLIFYPHGSGTSAAPCTTPTPAPAPVSTHHSPVVAPSSLANTLRTQYIAPANELAQEREFYLRVYKVLRCEVLIASSDAAAAALESVAPHNPCLCPRYHENPQRVPLMDKQRRRCPYTHVYDSTACAAVKPSADAGWRSPSVCPRGDACRFSHTFLESMYHPHTYKTVMCQYFDEHDARSWKRCRFERACAHAHTMKELEFNQTASNVFRQQHPIPSNTQENFPRTGSQPSLQSLSASHSTTSLVNSCNTSSPCLSEGWMDHSPRTAEIDDPGTDTTEEEGNDCTCTTIKRPLLLTVDAVASENICVSGSKYAAIAPPSNSVCTALPIIQLFSFSRPLVIIDDRV